MGQANLLELPSCRPKETTSIFRKSTMAWSQESPILPWVTSLFSDMKICAMARDRQVEQPTIEPAVQRGKCSELPTTHSVLHRRFNSIDSTCPTKEVRLPADFFQQLACMAVDDPHIAIRIEDDRTCPLIWGEAGSLRFLFLQMCIRDRWDKCRELWSQLDEYDRRDFMSVYRSGPPSPDFFLNMMVTEQDTWREMSDIDASSISSRSDNSLERN